MGGNTTTAPGKEIQVVGKSPTEVAMQALAMGYGKEALEVLRGISELQLKHDAENAKREFAIDMAACQQEMPVVPKKAKNTQTNSLYAKYEHITALAKPIYTKYGFSISFYEENSPKESHIRWCADVMHRSGHMVSRHVDIPTDDKGIKGMVNKTPTHAMKSSSSYGKGILLCHVFNIPTGDDVDDDGNGASAVQMINEDQKIEINDLLDEIYGKGTTKRQEAVEYMGVKDVADLTFEAYKKHRVGFKQLAEKRSK